MEGLEDARKWTERVFGGCDLGDPRRVDRLIDYAGRQACNPGASTSQACKGDSAAAEGAYRFLRNKQVTPQDIEDGVYEQTAELCRGRRVLAIQDSTGTSVRNRALAEELFDEGSPTGFMVHSTLMVDAATREILGLLDQARWIRPKKRPGKSQRRERPYEEKESFKWQAATERMRERLVDAESFVTVCDREADIFEYLQYQLANELHCVVRASWDRNLEDNSHLWEFMRSQTVQGHRTVEIGQRGGQARGGGQSARKTRKARRANVEVRAAAVSVCWPKSRKPANARSLVLNGILVTEPEPPDNCEALEWMLLTTEPIEFFGQIETVIEIYQTRWLIEEFHKAWKSGCNIEKRPVQTVETFERLMVITAPIAVRILQLRWLAQSADDETSCEPALTTEEWHCLWASTQPKKPLPTAPPTARWAYQAIGRLGGWLDTKRTGRIGWDTLWSGWDLLQQRVWGYRLAASNRPPIHAGDNL